MNNYNFEKLFQDYGIPHQPPNERNYIQIKCPYCRDNKFHGGINIITNIFTCWKCGTKPLADTIKILIGKDWYGISGKYKTNLNARDLYIQNKIEKPISAAELFLPRECTDLDNRQKKYLEKRGFDPNWLIQQYGLKATGPLGDYKFRIIIPIYWKGQLVSFQGRDYTGLSALRYKACSKDKEVIHHKHILYGEPRGDHAIVVEGIVDKWKMGVSAVATFGTGFTQQQVNLLSEWSKVSILYDGEAQAQKHAEELGSALAGMGSEVELILLKEGDPGDLPWDEAQTLTREILGE